ncbi:heterokaryon incompatibility protein-domain-containing protein [Suillus subaureus]|uniref:Heterokaryon incompatibility protein-domain-containing protein n=1 Tax=Suillus subaureus TaxID=48587 RepID=A0A9P7EMK6_9AGAM|nr:heterokaryon incompatibility protein-domain-containing protein [Suillus subaureus]KAG1825504.1 heterokaryon incompatibility protein-domain-containing protein [Suillus subaureus]
MVPPSFSATQSRVIESTLSPVSTHGLVLAGIIGGVALGVWVLWFVRTCKPKANVTVNESSPLLHPDQIGTDLQRDHVTTSDNEALLCSICASLNFYQIFLDGIPEMEDIPLDYLSSILKKSYQCSFCRLISFHVRRTWMLDKFPHVDISGIECRMFTKHCGCLQLATYPPSKFRCYRLHITMEGLEDLWKRYPAFRIAGALNIHLMQEDAFKFGRPTDLHCRRMKNTVDIKMVKKWIKLCQESHGDTCKSLLRIGEHDNRKLPGCVRVVDVILMAVVPAPSGCRYLALSYIWGGIGAEYWTTKDNIAERGTPGGLNAAKFPDTITDSILFVRQLGERYIWIDTLCIIQDNSQDKFTQIHNMDLIYGLSYLTIIAAGGTTARDPLPGCRPQTRTQQHIEVVQGLHLYAAPPRLKEALTLSAWSTRCWTYQECALSRRRIYFTGQQVYFECQFDVLCEDVIAESKCDSTSFLKFSRAEYFPQSLDPFTSYLTAVRQCTLRNLTVESDIVNAITGVTNALAKAFGLGDPDRAFRYGMMLTDLHHSLLWQHNPHTPRTRRSLPDGCSLPWPSWAWATWRGAVNYMSEHRYLVTHPEDAWLVDDFAKPSVVEMFVDPWYIVGHDGTIVQLDVRSSRRVVLIRESEREVSTYSSPRGIIDPTEMTTDIHRALDPGTLIFRTTSSHFAIAPRRGEELHASIHHGLFDILSGSSPPIWVGTAVLPLDIALPTSLEFIVLSRTGMHDGYDIERLEYYHECLLYVMAVSQNGGLMERVGLGVIHEAAWIASGAEEKVVFLR